MWTNPDGQMMIEDSIARLRADIKELEMQLPTWTAENTNGTKKYRPIAKRIMLSAERLQELVKENTYTP